MVQFHNTAPTSDTNHKFKLSFVLLTNGYINQGSHSLFLRFGNLLERLRNSGKHLTYVFQFIIKDTTQNSCRETMQRARYGATGMHGAFMPSQGHPLRTPMCSPGPYSEPCPGSGAWAGDRAGQVLRISGELGQEGSLG